MTQTTKIGRPSEYSQELVDKICTYIANGLSLRKLCDKEDIPVTPETIRVWLRDKPDFTVQYARARDEQADFYADEIIEKADEANDRDSAAAAKIKVDARKWVAAKLKPKKYGDKLDMTSGGERIESNSIVFMDFKDATTSK